MPAKKHNPRKTYSAPKLVKIELRVQEVALAGCKGAFRGPDNSNCYAPPPDMYCSIWVES